MNRRILLCSMLTCTTCAAAATTAKAGGVPVGSSALIGNLDYSDTFTENANRPDNQVPGVGNPGLAVENTYGHPAQNWSPNEWSFNKDGTTVSGGSFPIYPGGSGVGSASGITQSGIVPSTSVNFGLTYGLRSNYVVQLDAVQTPDWIEITSSSARDTIFAPNSLTVLFRAANNVGSNPQIGLYDGGAPLPVETAVPVSSGITTYGGWNNYAVDFDQADHLLKIYANQNLLTTVNLATFAGGIYENYSNADVTVGGAGETTAFGVLWTDNFQVGAAIVPEPSSVVALAGLGLFGLAGFMLRRRRTNGQPTSLNG